MKILITVASYYPNVDGVQNVTQYQAEGLAKLGHEVLVISSKHFLKNNYNNPDEEMHNGVRIIRVDAYKDFMINFGDKKGYQKLLEEYAPKVDVMMNVCPSNWNADWAFPLLDQLDCAKMLMVHGTHDFRWRNFRDRSAYGISRKIWGDIRMSLYFFYNWKNIKKYNVIAHLHEQDFAAQLFRRHGVEKECILYNAVDDQFFESDLKKENQIINVGTFSRGKNQIACLKAFYKSKILGWKLVLIGPSENRYYRELVRCKHSLERKYGHRDVEIMVGVSRQDTIKEVKRSKIYLLTSISEMFPVSLIEGMAAGCAWISTDVGINRYLPGGEIGNTVSEMANKITEIVDNDACAELGRKGQCFASENCRKEQQVRKLENILLSAVEVDKTGS